jgi:hypothetical protein
LEQENGSKSETDCFEKRGGEQCCGGSIVLDEEWFSLFFLLLNVNSISVVDHNSKQRWSLMIWGIIVQTLAENRKGVQKFGEWEL